MTTKKFIKDYLSFSRKERVGIIVLLALMVIVYVLPGLLRRPEKFGLEPGSFLAKLVDTVSARNAKKGYDQTAGQFAYESSSSQKNIPGALFRFDPNTIGTEEWKRLGLSDRTIKTVNRYTAKGGKFRKPEDLKKIWGIPAGFYERVKDYIEIKTEVDTKIAYKKDFSNERKPVVININEADTTAWIALPGIGSKLASRIINFRDKLGGFYSVDQVSETFGLPDSTFQKIKGRLASGGEIKKININTSTKDDLKKHPYIRWNLANAIVEYRSQHGNFETLQAIKNIPLITEDVFSKIAPYLTTE
ncbi:MAG: helix-hairpin-helix domain-containing protein [Flavisolibacter sp.]